MIKHHRNATIGFFTFLLMLSGYCGITYEVLYGRIIGNIIGDQFIVSAAILVAFLLGIGIGSLIAHRLWRFLWLIEAAIGVYGLSFALFVNELETLLYTSLPYLGSGMISTLLVCALLLIIPASLIGCCIPLFSGYLGRINNKAAFSNAYLFYNLGAAMTVILFEYLFLRQFGLFVTSLLIPVINFFVAAALLLGYRQISEQKRHTQPFFHFSMHQLTALILISIASAIYQLIMIKVTEFLFGPFRESFALVLGLVFLGITLGSWLTQLRCITFRSLLVLNLLGLTWFLASYEFWVSFYASYYEQFIRSDLSAAAFKFFILTLLMGLPSVTFGATIPALLKKQDNIAKASGKLLFISSLANVFGFLLMVSLLHQFLTYGQLMMMIATITTASLIVYQIPTKYNPLFPALLLAIVMVVHKVQWDEKLLFLGHTNFHSANTLSEARQDLGKIDYYKGHQDVMSINWIDNEPYFFINGYISMPLKSYSEALVGAYSSMTAPDNEQALVLGVGSGTTASVVSMLFDKTDAVEINPVILRNLAKMDQYNFQFSNRPGVNFIVDDAIHFVKANHKKYALIINTVTSPLYFSSSKLYTVDFFRHIKTNLKQNGVYVTWVDSRIGDKGIKIILKSLSVHFNHVWLASIKASYFVLLASQAPLHVHQPKLIAKNKRLSQYFMNKKQVLPEWLPYGLLSSHPLTYIKDEDIPINTIDFPVLEFEMAHVSKTGFRKFKKWLNQQLSLDDLKKALEPTIRLNPQHLVLYLNEILDDSNFLETWEKLVREKVTDFNPQLDHENITRYKVISEYLHTADSYHDYGYALMKAGYDKEAIPIYKKALQINPSRNNTHFNLGACFERQGALKKALKHYIFELTVDPSDKDIPYRAGRVYFKLGHFKLALAALDKALTHEINSKIKNKILKLRNRVVKSILKSGNHHYTVKIN